MKRQQGKLICGLDLGTTKVVAMVARIEVNGHLSVLGYGEAPSSGIQRGVIVDVEAAKDVIEHVITMAERAANVTIESVYVGIAGHHIRCLNSYGVVRLEQGEVNEAAIEQVLEASKAVALPESQRILHVLPQVYFVDNQPGTQDPVGQVGVRLEARVHIVVCDVEASDRIIDCVESCGLAVDGLVLEQLASSAAVLTNEEKAQGVCLVDIGGGTTDIAIFKGGVVRHSAVIPIGGYQVTNDLALALRTATHHAETIKVEHTSAIVREPGSYEGTVRVPGLLPKDEQHVSGYRLDTVVNARYEELFMMVLGELRRCDFTQWIESGIVLTGGGSSLAGAVELARIVFSQPVRLAVPGLLQGLDERFEHSRYATAVGLVLYGASQQQARLKHDPKGYHQEFGGVFKRMRHWVESHF